MGLSKDLLCDEFQNTVADYLIRHKSVIDVMTKLQESNARINRALAKTITYCGCLEVNAKKQQVPPNASLSELKNYMQAHIEGNLCELCKDVLETEIGTNLFYLTALCNLLGLSLYDIMIKEYDKVKTLGVYNLS